MIYKPNNDKIGKWTTWLSGSTTIVPTNTGTEYIINTPISKCHGIMGGLVYSGTIRVTMQYSIDSLIGGSAFFDFSFAGSRLYCGIDKSVQYPDSRIIIDSGGSSGSVSWGTGAGQCTLWLWYN